MIKKKNKVKFYDIGVHYKTKIALKKFAESARAKSLSEAIDMLLIKGGVYGKEKKA